MSGTENQVILLLDDDVVVREGLAFALEREGRTIITCTDVESAQLIVERVAVSHVISDIRLTGQFAFEGLDFITHALKQRRDTRVIVMSGAGSREMTAEAMNRGAVAFLEKPFGVEELEAMLLAPADTSTMDGSLISVPGLDEILASQLLTTRYQPIADLRDGDRFHAYEALIRFKSSSLLSNPEVLFQYAERKERVTELELACVRSSLLRSAPIFGSNRLLFMNVHPLVFASGAEFSQAVIGEAGRNGVALDRLVIEITEQASIASPDRSLAAIDELAERGVRFAFDDVGIAYSHLAHINRIKPAYMKISQHFGGGFEQDSTRTKIVKNILALASDFNAAVVLEGIETVDTLEAARDLGVAFGQGYYLGRPAELEQLGLAELAN